MILFKRLSLSGFKSFVDPTEMAIEAGMTGIVGPNGCGKSNLVEALRWVMGEGSAKQMRGGEMDDVIFAGSANRPRRDVAEVVVVLENMGGALPAPFDKAAELEVVRRIERGDGSIYRVNGREVRARDVQTLFADLASGARSTAIVGQGHIGALIAARPSDRRQLLEEAAGIAGLHARRHEAELRLKGADANLERLVDVLATLEDQAQTLKRQARHAARYRNLSQRIREAEAALLARQWHLARAEKEAAEKALAEIGGKVAELTGLAARAAARQVETQAGLPALRQADAEASARLQRLRTGLAELDAEEKRIGEQRQTAGVRLQQTQADIAREAARIADATEARARLTAERTALEAEVQAEADHQAEAQRHLAAAEAEAGRVETELTALMERLAAVDAERAAALRQMAEIEERGKRLARREADLEATIARTAAESVDQASLTSAEMDREEAEEYLDECRRTVEAAEAARAEAMAARDGARERLQSLSSAQATLAAEAKGLKAALSQSAGTGPHAPVIDSLSAVAGFETALGAALGEDLNAPVDADAPRSWHSPKDPAPEGTALPEEAAALQGFVTAPPALARRLAQIGVVENAEAGTRLARRLAVGQRLVDRDGNLWRWDGFSVKAGAPSAAALRLRQRARLRELEAQIEDRALGVEEAKTTTETATVAVDRATAAEKAARDAVKKAETEAKQKAEAHLRLAQKAAQADERKAALERQKSDLSSETAETKAALTQARDRMARFPEGAAERERIAALRADLAERRTGVVEARSALERLKSEAAGRARRLLALVTEEKSWTARAGSAQGQMTELEERRKQNEEELARLDALPEQIAASRNRLLDETATADEARRQAADALAQGEQAQSAADKLVREAETALALAREDMARREAAVEAKAGLLTEIGRRVGERLSITPDALPEDGGEDTAELSEHLEKLVREREAMGPVNLMAETEAETLRQRLDLLYAERDDLVAAIAKLRHGISEINREGRDRLRASFEVVDRHFRTLFVRLFGGGRAYLTLTDPEDPLQAGLEIMASPPGKRLQILTLLSGGEQALTALALLFAVFMTNPAPICVLDEVDAPLDDANVDRFCSLVSEITETLGTRFLVVTHHRMTMARMDRLFGVTMAERGISTLVSVNLQKAEQMRELTST